MDAMSKKNNVNEAPETKEVRAVAKYIHSTPRKLRLVMDAVRGKAVNEALTILRFTPKRAARILEKVLNSAVANAENNCGMSKDSLVISRAWVDCGPTAKRWIPRAQGRASGIHNRTSHITFVVKEEVK